MNLLGCMRLQPLQKNVCVRPCLWWRQVSVRPDAVHKLRHKNLTTQLKLSEKIYQHCKLFGQQFSLDFRLVGIDLEDSFAFSHFLSTEKDTNRLQRKVDTWRHKDFRKITGKYASFLLSGNQWNLWLSVTNGLTAERSGQIRLCNQTENICDCNQLFWPIER